MISVLSLYESSFNVSNSVIASSNACYKYTSSLLTTLHTFNVPFSGTTTVSQYQKGKINVDFTEARTVSGSGISLAVCKSAPCPRQITMPAPHHSVFLQAGCPSCCPTNSVRALKALHLVIDNISSTAVWLFFVVMWCPAKHVPVMCVFGFWWTCSWWYDW